MRLYHIRDWNIILDLDGSISMVENSEDTEQYEASPRQYSARYRLPAQYNNLAISSKESTQRQELFALGGLFYQLMSNNEPFHNIYKDEESPRILEQMVLKGGFPDDVWYLPMARVILGCWLPEFAIEQAPKTELG